MNQFRKINRDNDSISNCKHIINKLNKNNRNNKKRCKHGSNLSFLWTIKKNNSSGIRVSNFFGTIHVAYTRVWDSVSTPVKTAFQTSDSVFFELDLLDPFTVTSLANCQILPNGKRLAEVLPNDLYKRLKSHLDYVRRVLPSWVSSEQREKRLYAEYLFNALTANWERKRPVWAMLMINALTETDVKSRGIPVLDLYLAQEAQRLNKNVGSIEIVEDQCIPLNGLNRSEVLFALNQTLSQHEAIRYGTLRPNLTTDDLIRHYNCGDLNEIIFNQDTTHVPILQNSTMYNNKEELEFARHIDDYFRSELIVKRNKRMSERVLNLLNSQPDHSFFFAFGAGHFLGDHSILNFVQENGYEVNRVSVNEFHNTKIKKRFRFKCESQHNLHNTRVPVYQTGAQNTIRNVSFLNSKKYDVNNNLILQTKQDIEQQTDSAVTKILVNNSNNSNVFGNLYTYATPLLPVSTISSLFRAKLTTSIVSTTSSTILAEHYSSPKQQHRKFNDLWVRLETVTTKPPLRIPRQQLLNNVEIARNNLRVWYTTASIHSNSTSILNINSHSSFILILFYILHYYLNLTLCNY